MADVTVRRGDVVQLGRHRLMCGDAGEPADVGKLFDGAVPDLVFTSPPYLNQRAYSQVIPCWDTLMQRVFGAMPHHEKTQVLVNLGLVHRKGEWVPYWDGWLHWMRARGWRRFGWYVWDKGESMAGNRNGRLSPTFEFVFHACKSTISTNKTQPCKHAGVRVVTNRLEFRGSRRGKPVTVGTHKVISAVLHCTPHKGGRTGHPAAFPISLPTAIQAAYSQPGQVVYDPFCGSGTSLLAAEQGGRICYGMEVSEAYCAGAVERWHRAQEKARQPAKVRRPRRPQPSGQQSLWADLNGTAP